MGKTCGKVDSLSFPVINFPTLPPNTIVPEKKDLYIPYFNTLYENIATSVNSKDTTFFPIAITSTPTNIPNLPNFGAFLVCVSGVSSQLPTIVSALCKSDAGVAGSTPAVLNFQAGTGSIWNTFVLAITSTATNFQIAHNNTGISGNFNIRIIRTQ